MKILDRYITREFLKAFVFGILALILVSTVVDIFDRVDDIVQNKPPFSVTLTYFTLRIPQTVFMITPISILLTTLLVTGAFARNSEVIAMLAGGVSIYRILVPLLVVGCVVSLFMFGLNEFIIPPSNRIKDEAKRIIRGKPDTRKMAKIQFWFRSEQDQRLYYINALIPERLEMHGLTVFELNDQFIPVRRLDAQRAVYHPASDEASDSATESFFRAPFAAFRNNGQEWHEENQVGTWTLYQGSERTLSSTKSSIFMFQQRKDYKIPHTFEEFRRETKDPEDMNYQELRVYIDTLTQSGYDASEYIVDLRAKFSYPFVSLVMVIIGFPFALKSPRSGAAMGVGLSVFIGITYWITLQLGISLGHAHILPPTLAAWISHIIFASAGFYLILSTRT